MTALSAAEQDDFAITFARATWRKISKKNLVAGSLKKHDVTTK